LPKEPTTAEGGDKDKAKEMAAVPPPVPPARSPAPALLSAEEEARELEEMMRSVSPSSTISSRWTWMRNSQTLAGFSSDGCQQVVLDFLVGSTCQEGSQDTQKGVPDFK